MGREPIDIIESIIQRFVKINRPPENIREKLDIGYSYDGKNIVLFEIRPKWNEPQIKLQLPYAKIRYIKSRKLFKLYWMRASGKWELYEPFAESTDIRKLLDCINEDSYGCFNG